MATKEEILDNAISSTKYKIIEKIVKCKSGRILFRIQKLLEDKNGN